VGKIACRSAGIFARNGRDFAHAVDAELDRVGNGEEAVAHPTGCINFTKLRSNKKPPGLSAGRFSFLTDLRALFGLHADQGK